MDGLPEALFNQVRSYLSFEELHRTRVTCKAWTNVEKVEKFINFYTNLESPFACLSNIKSLAAASDTKEKDVQIMRCLNLSRLTLRDVSLGVSIYLDDPSHHRSLSHWVIPILPNLQKLNFNPDCDIDQMLLKRSKSITKLCVYFGENDFDEDLHRHAKVESIHVYNCDDFRLFKPTVIQSLSKVPHIYIEEGMVDFKELTHILQMVLHSEWSFILETWLFRIDFEFKTDKTITVSSFILMHSERHDLRPVVIEFTTMLNSIKNNGCNDWTFVNRMSNDDKDLLLLYHLFGESNLFRSADVTKKSFTFKPDTSA